MRISKGELKYKDRLAKELLIRVIPWVLFSICLFWIFFEKENIFFWITFLIVQLIGLSIMIQTSFQWAKYQIVNVEIYKEFFRVQYLEKDILKEINSNKNETFKIELKNHNWGIFPLDPKKRVNSLVLENHNIKIAQYNSKPWKSTELHNLYYDGFQFYYHKYWLNKFDLNFKN